MMSVGLARRAAAFGASAVVLAGLSAGLMSSPAQAATKAAPKVSVSAPKATPGDYEGSCPTKVNFSAQIKVPVKGKTELAYRWLHGDGSKSKVSVIKLKGKGVKTVTVKQAITFKENVKGWEAVQVLGPKKVTSKKGYFSVSCKKPQDDVRTHLDVSVSARAWASPSTYAGSCDTRYDKIDFTGLIKVDRPSWVRYRWVLNGDVVDYGKIKVRDARKVGFGIAPRHSQRGWAQLQVLSPDSTSSNRAYYKVWCKDEHDAPKPPEHHGKVSASASVTMDTSCVVTAAGKVTSTGPGRVSYSWSVNGQTKVSDAVVFGRGEHEKSLTALTFAAAEGEAAKGGTVTLTITGPNNGDVVTQSYPACQKPAPEPAPSQTASAPAGA
ncbi:hypothetical protein FXF51_25265 [Nonomuraea sp. PA05]|uniref:hypothetical protein n=1 Tax=Nonomuraea sp. PA05 TaxID=2604466 RepID=UPI0011D99D70|nr:hypothetical protein [Nonomuraea sp. PA05]TYB62740.1 hypothetical protein FXF51_25265 [Nonomuraea sp. PA05]